MTASATKLRKATGLDLLLLTIMVSMWGGAFSAIRISAHHLGPFWLAADRVFLGFMILASASIFLPALRLSAWMPWPRLFQIAILNVSIPFCLISWAELEITASMTALLMGTGPFMALIILHYFTSDEKLNGLKILAALLGFSAVLIAVGADIKSAKPQQILPVLAVIGASLSYVISGLLVRKTAVKPMALATGTLLMGSVQLIPLALLLDGAHPAEISQPIVFAIIFLGLCPTGIAYILRYYLIQNIGYSLVALGINALPVMGVVIAAIALGEHIPLPMILALGLVILGVLLARQASSPTQKPYTKATK